MVGRRAFLDTVMRAPTGEMEFCRNLTARKLRVCRWRVLVPAVPAERANRANGGDCPMRWPQNRRASLGYVGAMIRRCWQACLPAARTIDGLYSLALSGPDAPAMRTDTGAGDWTICTPGMIRWRYPGRMRRRCGPIPAQVIGRSVRQGCKEPWRTGVCSCAAGEGKK